MLNPNVMQSVIVEYETTTNTIPQIAANHQLKPADVSAILRMSGVTIKRGPRDMTNHPLLNPDTRAKRLATLKSRALHTKLRSMVEEHSYEVVLAALETVTNGVAGEDAA
jgi:hypothetical protein